MTRRAYEAVALAILLGCLAGVTLYRYHRERGRFHHLFSLPCTGDVRRVDLHPRVESRLDLNCATHAELDAIPGISSNIAAAIIARRVEKPFDHVAELVAIDGIGEKRFAVLTEHVVCIPPPAPNSQTKSDDEHSGN